MNECRFSKSGDSIDAFESTPVATLISEFMGEEQLTLIHERDRLEAKLHNNGPPGGLLPLERQRLAAVRGALVSQRMARHAATAVICLVTALVALGTDSGLNQAVAAPRAEADDEAGVQVLTRGPVHEAFAETVTFDSEPGIVVPKSPPDAIEELPPEQRPTGANVSWIPGYWAWDDERADFLWVSGIWRSLPPGRQWVAGYWGDTGQGSQWTSGYWADAKASEVEYLPEPPQSVEVGPSSEATSPDHSWAPGSWVWHQNRYAWRPGYWAEVQPDWVWVPAHYVWTRRGYVFVDGYNDYAVSRRGVLFAPVYFDASVYSRRGFSYSPLVVIDLGLFTEHLFLRPNYGHYYFGDYYASSYHSSGFYPWFSFHTGGYGYDPFYAHYRWNHRSDREWEHRVEADFGRRRDHEEARPPRTLAALKDLNTSKVISNDKSLVVATSLDELSKGKNSPMKFQSVDQAERQKLATHGEDIRKFREERQALETKSADPSGDKSSKKSEPVKMKLPQSPFVAKSTEPLGSEHAPPKAHEAPQPDPKIEPQPRTAGGGPSSREGKPNVTKVEPKPEATKGESKDIIKGESKAKAKGTAKREAKEQPKGEPKPNRGNEPKPNVGNEPKPNRGNEPKPNRGNEPKPNRGNEPKPNVGNEPKPNRGNEPKPNVGNEPKPNRGNEPKPNRDAGEAKPNRGNEPKPNRDAGEARPNRGNEPQPNRGGGASQPNRGGASNDKPKGEANDKSRGEPNNKPK